MNFSYASFEQNLNAIGNTYRVGRVEIMPMKDAKKCVQVCIKQQTQWIVQDIADFVNESTEFIKNLNS